MDCSGGCGRTFSSLAWTISVEVAQPLPFPKPQGNPGRIKSPLGRGKGRQALGWVSTPRTPSDSATTVAGDRHSSEEGILLVCVMPLSRKSSSRRFLMLSPGSPLQTDTNQVVIVSQVQASLRQCRISADGTRNDLRLRERLESLWSCSRNQQFPAFL